MSERYYMACLLSLAALAAVIFLAWTSGLGRFNPAWIIAASTTVTMVWVVYAVVWLTRLCVSLERLLHILTEQQPEATHSLLCATLTVNSDDVTDNDAAA